MADLSARIEELSPQKQRLLALLRRQRPTADREAAAAATPEPFALVAAADRRRLPPGLEDAYPLASMQLGMLYHMHMTLDDPVPAYHNVFVYRLKTALDLGSLGAALAALLARHAVLRTAFDLTTYSEPLQLVYRRVELPLTLLDLDAVAAGDRQRIRERFLAAANRRVLPLGRPPLMRFHLLRAAAAYLVVAECHAIAEGWTTVMTLREMHANYLALAAGDPPPFRQPPPVPYREFIRLERETLASPASRAFWRQQLDGATVARLPRLPEGDRRAERSLRRKHVFRLPVELAAALEGWARERDLPLKSVLLSAHLKVLGLLSGENDLTSGYEVHGRPERLGSEQTAGLFVNTLPLRFRLDGGSWEVLARRAFEAEVELLPHRRYPIAALQKAWGKEPLLDLAFTFLDFHFFGRFEGWSGGETEEAQDLDLSVTHFPLHVVFSVLSRSPMTIIQLVENDDTEITANQVRAFHRYYLAALRALVAAPACDHDARCLLPRPELHLRLQEWNDSGPVDVWAAPVHEGIAARAAAEPDAVAVVAGEETWSFRCLDRRAAALASRLRRAGVGPEVVVGVSIERSPELIAALLAVHKAGGAYLPLDPGYPRERLEFMLADAAAAVLLTDAAGTPPWVGERTRVLAVGEHGFAAGGEAAAAVPLVAESLAYVIYTSGSTGQPKGVAIRHGGFAALVQWAWKEFAAEELAAVLATTSICFDLSVFEIFAPLWGGGRVVVVRDAAALHDAVGMPAVTLVNTVPSVMQELLRSGGLPPSVRTVNLAGEALKRRLVDDLFQLPSVRRVLNLYGPSEATTYSTVARMHRRDIEAPAIGRPVTGTRTYLVDRRGWPVPTAVPGEMWVGGAGLARGYLGRPRLSADRFRPDLFSDQAGARVYRTGDLCRYRPDGEVEFLGRRDHQVKLRGFRIELGEIEAALVRHPALAAVAVQPWEDAAGQQRLVAYAVPAAGRQVTVGELRSSLRRSLPDYLVPSLFEFLEVLPMTPNGKVDRNALPAPSSQRPVLGAEYVAPRSALERALGEVWCEVLGRDRVGVHDDFFELGGDSLLLLRAHLKIQGRFEREVPLADLFRYPTVRALAAHLSGGADERAARREGERRGAQRRAEGEGRARRRQQRRRAARGPR